MVVSIVFNLLPFYGKPVLNTLGHVYYVTCKFSDYIWYMVVSIVFNLLPFYGKPVLNTLGHVYYVHVRDTW